MTNGRIVEGLWDCPYCQTKAIGGLKKHCPCCGHPQDDDTQFYMGSEIKYLDEDLAKQYGQGADWVCAYCAALNRVHYKYCATCGAGKDDSGKDYFTPDAQNTPAQKPTQTKAQPAKGKGSKLPLILLALAAILAFVFWPRNVDSQVTGKNWQRTSQVEAYRTVEESDWSLPDGGRTIRTAREIHHYDNVLDHYETRTRQVAESVYDGDDVSVSYVNNGDGTFTEVENRTPRYRTEYHEETYEAPVYVQVPVHATKYYYEIERWVYDRTMTATGEADPPYWPDCQLKDNERERHESERYTVTVQDSKNEKTYSFNCSQSMWESLKDGQEVTLTVSAGRVTKVNDEAVK